MLTLIVPGLIWTHQALADLTCDLPLPAFTTLLGRGRLIRRPPQGTAATLAELSDLRAPLPAAALRRLALRQDSDASSWLCLDPVRLRFEERRLIVDDPRQLDLSDEEAAALAVSLAPTFAGLGQLEVLAACSWNLRLSVGAPDFQALSEAAGRAAAPLPLSSAYTAWRQAINEAQMVLHDHPVNRAREAVGRPLVNSLWPWGGGALPQSGDSTHDAIWSDDPVAQGIARLLQVDCGDLPASYVQTTARAPLAVIDALEQPALIGDGLVWREQLARFEADWLSPVLDALRSGQLDALRLIAPGDLRSAELMVRRGDLWKFWRKPASLTVLGAA